MRVQTGSKYLDPRGFLECCGIEIEKSESERDQEQFLASEKKYKEYFFYEKYRLVYEKFFGKEFSKMIPPINGKKSQRRFLRPEKADKPRHSLNINDAELICKKTTLTILDNVVDSIIGYKRNLRDNNLDAEAYSAFSSGNILNGMSNKYDLPNCFEGSTDKIKTVSKELGDEYAILILLMSSLFQDLYDRIPEDGSPSIEQKINTYLDRKKEAKAINIDSINPTDVTNVGTVSDYSDIIPVSKDEFSLIADTYVARPELLECIAQTLEKTTPDGKHICVVKGVGGSGKSELVRAWVEEKAGCYNAKYWFTSTGKPGESLSSLFKDSGNEISLSDSQNFDENILLVIDNYDKENPKLLRDIIKNTGSASVFITSRLQGILPIQYREAHEIDITDAEDKETFSENIFSKNYCTETENTRKTLAEEQTPFVHSICRLLGYNPLLVTLTAIELREHDTYELDSFAEKLQNGLTNAVSENTRINYQHNEEAFETSVFQILEILFRDFLTYQFNTSDYEVFTLLWLVPAMQVSQDLICNLLPGAAAIDSLKLLIKHGWLKHGRDISGNGFVELHPLIWELITQHNEQFALNSVNEEAFCKNCLLNWFGYEDISFISIPILIRYLWDHYRGACASIPKSFPSDEIFELGMMCLIQQGSARKRIENHSLPSMIYTLEKEKERFLIQRTFSNKGIKADIILLQTELKSHTESKCYILYFIETQNLEYSITFPEDTTVIQSYAFYNCKHLSGELLFPNKLVSIGDCSFWGCIGLTGQLKLPDSLSTIGDSAFYNCNNLSGNLHIPSHLKSIGDATFCNCSSLTGILHLPITLTSIGDLAFFGCSNISGDLRIPDSVTIIGRWAFCNCSALSGELSFSMNLTSIGDHAFEECRGLIGELILPDSISFIGNSAFYRCSGLSGNLHIPDSLTCISDFSFGECVGLNGTLHLSNTLVSIGECAFSDCRNLKGPLELPDLLEIIGDSAFVNCEELTGEIILPPSLSSIGEYAFANCSKLTGLPKFPPSLTSIGNWAFYRCIGLTGSLDIPETLVHVEKKSFAGCSGLDLDQCTFENPSLSCTISNGNIYLSEGITTVGNKAFHSSSLTGELHIPNSVTSIGESAFYRCHGLIGNLILPDSILSIGSGAFNGCEGLTGELHIPTSITAISPWTFYHCERLTGRLYIPDSVTTIEEMAFCRCNNFSGEPHLSKSLISIGKMAFYRCSGLTGTLQIPDSVTSIDSWAFYHCNGFSGELYIPDSVTYIGESAFQHCSGLTGELHIPNSLTYIGNEAFTCTDIKKVYIYSSTVIIHNQPFNNDVIIYGWPNSTAETYAHYHRLDFVPFNSYL